MGSDGASLHHAGGQGRPRHDPATGEAASAREKAWGAHEKLTIQRKANPTTRPPSRKSKGPKESGAPTRMR